jgi:branched-subunit amino acid transport protein AzlD
MTEFWLAVIIGSVAVYSWKLIGYLIPKKFSENREVARFATALTIALLAALTALQTLSSDREIALDSRLLALGVAAVMFWRKLPFILVVASAAAVAAAARYFLGWQ